MSQLNADLESNLVSGRRDLSNRTNDQLLLLDTQPESPQENIQEETRYDTEYSLAFNLLAIFVPGPKILASIVVLLISQAPCVGAKQIWLMCMLVHDFLHFVIITMRLQVVFALRRLASVNSSNASVPQNGERVQQSIQLVSPQRDLSIDQPNQENFNQPLNENSDTVLNRLADKKASIARLNALCTYVWMFLFIFWLELDTITDTTECDTVEVNNLVLAFVLIGWVWLLNPLLICMAGCLCLPVLLIVLCIFGKPNQVPASRNIISSLPIKTYTPDLPGNKECAICIGEYQPDEKIIQLECSAMHHFHEPCLKDWLKINGQCPICRARIGEKRDNSSENNNRQA